MLQASELFAKRRLVPEKLLAYGFCKEGDAYAYQTVLPASRFELTVSVAPADEDSSAGGACQVSTVLMDAASHEEYTLHRVPGAAGAFVGAVRDAYEAALLDIAEQCSERDVFKTANARAVIRYIWEKYGDGPEYLWDKFPDNAVFRIPVNQKWYAALLRVSGAKLGLPTDEMTDILDLKAEPEELSDLVDGQRYLPGYHMNKKHWYTIPLEGPVPLPEICERIDRSYAITMKRG